MFGKIEMAKQRNDMLNQMQPPPLNETPATVVEKEDGKVVGFYLLHFFACGVYLPNLSI